MSTAIEHLAELVVGSVESVAPDEIRVLLELDAPQTTALNTGVPAGFPRLNSYLLIPNEAGATVAYITWIGIERSPYPKRSGFKDFGLIDLPFPLRKMSLSPVGTLTAQRGTCGAPIYELSRGVLAFPSVGDQVLIPTAAQIAAIVGAKNEDRRVRIGSSPMAGNATIMVDPDKLFGRHLAVLGNTGSGKSCTVAGLIRWSMEAASAAIKAGEPKKAPNARFIVLDPNGEYARAFADAGANIRLFRVPPVGPNERPLDIPGWLWNGHEWSAVAHAQPGAQRPLLLQGLRELKAGYSEAAPRGAILRRHLTSYSVRLSAMLAQGTSAFAGQHRARFECARLLERIAADSEVWGAETECPTPECFVQLATDTAAIIQRRRSGNSQFFDDFAVTDLESTRAAIDQLAQTLPELSHPVALNEDTPTFFDVKALAEHLDHIATEQGGNLAGFISTLGLRIRGMMADHRLGDVIGKEPPTSFDQWLTDYVGGNEADNGQVGIIDLSLVPSEIVHIVVSVLARLVFESLQRYRRDHLEGKTLPTVLVLEEAHNFVRRGQNDEGPASSPSQLCREIFERIAREGRKFGLGLVLSSQRPSELSPTVLAQCNTFVLHRIVNDADQNLVARLVPDNVGGLLRELPSLPSRQAVLLGWAAPIPVLVEVEELPEHHRPQSADPDFWNVWTRANQRSVTWTEIVRKWTSVPTKGGAEPRIRTT